MEDRPKSLKNEAERVARRQLLKQEHILPLTCLVDEIKQDQPHKKTPYFDPLDGGIEAQCLFVLEAPGPKAVESGFVSRNNNDETAKNFFKINEGAGIPRTKTITWNIVPWYLGKDGKIQAAKSSDIEAGLPYLFRLRELLPKLRVIVLVGRKAQKVEQELRTRFTDIEVFKCYHPSPLFVNNNKRNRQKILDELKLVKHILDGLT